MSLTRRGQNELENISKMGVKCWRTALLLQLESLTGVIGCGRRSTGRLERFPNENSVK